MMNVFHQLVRCCLLLLIGYCAVSAASAANGHASSTSAADDDFDFAITSSLVNRVPDIEQTQRSAQLRRRSIRTHQRRRPRQPLLNCPIYYFPAPNQHIFCCYKEDFCKCPRPMGVCAGVTYEDLFSGHG